jgi:mevalonate kinase
MTKKIAVSAPAKIYFMGEHAVTYGKPGLLAAVNRRCYVHLSARKDELITVLAQDGKIKGQFSLKDAVVKTQNARRLWQEFEQTHDGGLLKQIIQSELDFIKIGIVETYAFYQRQPVSGLDIVISSDIPLGSGLGSSAALAVALAGGLSAMMGLPFDLLKISSIAYEIEKKQHGLPSGADNTTASLGGLVWFRKESPLLKTMAKVDIPLSPKLKGKFWAIQTGRPLESTGEMVSSLRQLYAQDKIKVNQFLDSQEEITRQMLEGLKDGDMKLLQKLIRAGEKNLESVGVVSDQTQKLIKEIEAAGGAAKICGAGGKKENSGVVLAILASGDKLANLLKTYQYPFFNLVLGEEGVRLETK